MRPHRSKILFDSIFLAASVLASLGAAACRDQQSFVVVTVQSDNPTPIAGVVDLVVTVTNGPSVKTLTYPAPATDNPFTITGSNDPATGKIGKTLSVSFTLSHEHVVSVDVSARDAAKCTIGHGMGSTLLNKGGVTTLNVELAHTLGPCEGADGGPADGNTFPGCDPATLSCGSGLTCAVNCRALQGQCVAAGSTGPGGGCATGNIDCQPGTQCFTYSDSTSACNVPVCLKFCKTDDDCGPGSGSVCQGKVPCSVDGGTLLTSYHTCSFACDPRGLATTGCPNGLRCFVVDTMDQVDCSCTESTRIQTEGGPCTRGVDCAPGLICEATTSKCQKICKRSENSADCGGKVCTMLREDQIYGVCL